MVLRVVVNNNHRGPHSNYRIGKIDNGYMASLDIAEIIAFPSVLSDKDRATVEGYLAHKWELKDKLPASHPYKGASPLEYAPVITVPSATGEAPIPVSITFMNAGLATPAIGFDKSDVTVTNATIVDFAGSGHTYTFNLDPAALGSVNISIPAGAAKTVGGTSSVAASATTKLSWPYTRLNDLIAYWNFDEGSGTTAKDSSPMGNDIANIKYQGNPKWVDGKFGSALEYNNSSTSLPLAAHPPAAGTEFSIAFWSFGGPTLKGKSTSVMESAGGAGRIINIHHPWSNGNVYWDVGNGGHDRINKNPGDAINFGNWTHWVFIHNRATGNMKWYVNGKLNHSGGNQRRTLGIPNRWYLGANSNGNGTWWYGIIDDLRIYKVELTPAEVAAVYNDGDGDGPPPIRPTFTYANASKTKPTVTMEWVGDVTGLTADDIKVTNAVLSDFRVLGKRKQSFKLKPTAAETNVNIFIAEGSANVATDKGAASNDETNENFNYVRGVTRQSEMLAWFKFDEGSGSEAASSVYAPGLLEGTLGGNMSFTANPGNRGITQEPYAARAGGNGQAPWAGNTTIVYTGQIYDADGKIAFYENIDDKAWLMVNGQKLLDNSGWNQITSKKVDFGAGGWFDFEVRFSNGGGGAGEVGGMGFGWDETGTKQTTN
ncbi:MAG: LamG-like jellyroll fold domain-containing protein, partial [Opitutales bacterium]